MADRYFVVRGSDDGGKINVYDKNGLQSVLQERAEYYPRAKLMTEQDADKEGDPNYWGDDILIIKGEVIRPKYNKNIEGSEIP